MAVNFVKNAQLFIDDVKLGYITSFSPSDKTDESTVTTSDGDVLKSANTTSTEISVDREGITATPEDDIAILNLVKAGKFSTGFFSAIKTYDDGQQTQYVYTLGPGTIRRTTTYGSTDQITESFTIKPSSYNEEIQVI